MHPEGANLSRGDQPEKLPPAPQAYPPEQPFLRCAGQVPGAIAFANLSEGLGQLQQEILALGRLWSLAGIDSIVGDNCRFEPNVVIYYNCRVGSNCIIGSNCAIGTTGFGYYFIDDAHQLIPHTGGVVIEDFVEIGGNCCIDRAKFGNTIIGAGTKMDNLVHIAHNVVIGKCCLLAGCVAIAGSTTVGNGVVMAGQVGVKDHVSIGDGTQVGAQSGVATDIASGQRVLGTPAIDAKEELRNIFSVHKLPAMKKQLRKLVKRIETLEAAKDNS